jgi:hypothetical protein
MKIRGVAFIIVQKVDEGNEGTSRGFLCGEQIFDEPNIKKLKRCSLVIMPTSSIIDGHYTINASRMWIPDARLIFK